MPKKKSNGEPLKPREVCKMLYDMILHPAGQWQAIEEISKTAKTMEERMEALTRYLSVRNFDYSSTLADAKRLWAIAKWLGLTLPKGISFPNGWAKNFK